MTLIAYQLGYIWQFTITLTVIFLAIILKWSINTIDTQKKEMIIQTKTAPSFATIIFQFLLKGSTQDKEKDQRRSTDPSLVI